MTLEELERASGGTVKQTKYLKQNPVRQFLIGQYLETITGFIRRTPAKKVLDLGCGEGFVLRHVRDGLPALSLTGVDIELDVLRVAAYQNPSALIAAADGLRLSFRSNEFDLVLCNEVLEHLESPQALLREVMRVGTTHFIFSVPREPHYRVANMLVGANWSRWGDDIDHQQRWTKKQFVAFLGQHFQVVDIKPSFPWIMALCNRP